jgi:hypothetical protein
MIHQTLSLVGALYGAIGPGFLLAAALPFLVIALGVVVRLGVRRARATD